MSLFFETIKVTHKRAYNLHYHNLRLNNTIKANFTAQAPIDLAKHIKLPEKEGLYRCKVIYNTTIQTITYTPYTPRTYHSLTLIESALSYPYKALDRSAIDTLFSQRGASEDIIIFEDGLLKDTSIANIALFDGLSWYTPKTPLLQGTQRELLLAKKVIKTKDLRVKELENCTKFAIMNAMIGFYELKNITFTKA